MTKKNVIVRQIFDVEVRFNNGDWADIPMNPIYVNDGGIACLTLEIERDHTECTTDEFQRRFPVGAHVNIRTTIEINDQSNRRLTRAVAFKTSLDSRIERGRATSFRLVNEIRQKIVRIFPSMVDLSGPEHPWVPIGVVLISAELLQTTDVSKLFAFTGYSQNFVAAIAFNLIHNNVWSRDGHFGSQYRSWFSFFPDSVITNEN